MARGDGFAAPVTESSAIHHNTGAPNTLPNLFDIESETRQGVIRTEDSR
jgi:hypothetical protein